MPVVLKDSSFHLHGARKHPTSRRASALRGAELVK